MFGNFTKKQALALLDACADTLRKKAYANESFSFNFAIACDHGDSQLSRDVIVAYLKALSSAVNALPVSESIKLEINHPVVNRLVKDMEQSIKASFDRRVKPSDLTPEQQAELAAVKP